jgi:hypothetical protein
MTIVKEKQVTEANFQNGAVKNLQLPGSKARIVIKVDLAEAVKELRYDVLRYGITREQLKYQYLAEVIAHDLDWRAYALSTNDDHDLVRLLTN